MNVFLVVRTLGILLFLFSGSLIPPVLISFLYDDGELLHFTTTLVIAASAGALLWLPLLKRRERVRTRDGFIIVAMLWIIMSLLSSLPFVFGLHMDIADAFFEAASAFTTTGATVITGLDQLPPSILFYRQELQWLGGIGVIVSAIALLPMLGVGGMQLFKAETPGPMKEEKLTPRIAHTAQTLWRLYLAMTVACALFYWVAGMSGFDAVAHAFSTVSTGGFSTHDASLSYFDSAAIELIAVVFMLLGAISFNIHFLVWRELRPAYYWRNVEVRAFLLTVLVVTLLVAGVLHLTGYSEGVTEALRLALFETASVITSTGFGIDDFSIWPLMLPVLLMFISFIGGCAGSTAGGMKVIRFVVIAKQASLEVQQLIHPNLVRPLKLNGSVVPGRIVQSIWGFFAVYVGVFAVTMLLMMAGGMDQVTAFGAVATCMNNLGPGLGDVAANFTTVDDLSKGLLALVMIMGRLEIFTIFVLMTPAFWRQ